MAEAVETEGDPGEPADDAALEGYAAAELRRRCSTRRGPASR